MPGTTPNLALRYPLGTERPTAAQIKALADDTDAAITAARDRHNGAWTAYTPTWFNASSTHSPIGIGDGSLTGGFLHVGRTVHFWIHLVRGASSGQGVARWAFTLPVQPRNSRWVSAAGSIFSGGIIPVFGYGVYASAPYGHSIALMDGAGAAINWGYRTWSAGDSVYVSGTYEALTDGA